ncbi:MAG: TRAP transporter small permease [Cloacibacillus sp.]
MAPLPLPISREKKVAMSMLKILNSIEEKFLVLNLLISTLIVFMNVVLRYCFSASLSWVDEAARYMFIWLIWIGADYTLANRKHLRIDIISSRLHGKARITLELFVMSVWCCFCVFLGCQGTKLVRTVVEQQQLSTAMQISMGWAYLCIPLAGIFMAIRLVFDIINLLRTGEIVKPELSDEEEMIEEAKKGVTM